MYSISSPCLVIYPLTIMAVNGPNLLILSSFKESIVDFMSGRRTSILEALAQPFICKAFSHLGISHKSSLFTYLHQLQHSYSFWLKGASCCWWWWWWSFDVKQDSYTVPKKCVDFDTSTLRLWRSMEQGEKKISGNSFRISFPDILWFSMFHT